MDAVTAPRAPRGPVPLEKAPTGIAGLDAITAGGLPRGRTTLVCGGTGCGKTLLGIEFLVRGARQFGEPGMLITFEETRDELTANAASLGFDLPALESAGLLSIDQVLIGSPELQETGDYDLDGLLIRLGWAIDQVGAKRIVIDTIEMLFTMLSDERVLRREIRRLFRWLNDRGMTAVVTAEQGDGKLTRHGLEEYVSDCVIVLTQSVERQTATRRLRVVKYRGSAHGNDETPFLITDRGFSVVPVGSLTLEHAVSHKRISTGVPRLDGMLGGKGFYRGSSVLVSGSPGAGKTSVAAQFVDAACRRGERVLYVAYEESPDAIVRNMRSIGLDLDQWLQCGSLVLSSDRTTSCGLEGHLARLHGRVAEIEPQVVVIDPISAYRAPEDEITAFLQRLVDFLKVFGVTALFTSMASSNETIALSGLGISSVIDTWITIRAIESNGERNRVLDVVKARGIAHSNQVRELVLSSAGLDLPDVDVDLDGFAVGSERVAREGERKRNEAQRTRSIELRRQRLTLQRAVVEAEIAALQTRLAIEVAEADESEGAIVAMRKSESAERTEIANNRQADPGARPPVSNGRRH